MLQCFFDDSGTHDGARVVVWGGVVGRVEQFTELEREWNALLRNPPHDKPPLIKYSQFDCRARINEFTGYNDAESDHLQYCFRNIVINSGVVPVTYGTDVAAWNRHVSGRLREFVGSAESASYGLCAKLALQLAVENDEKISLVFDQGAMSLILQTIYSGACGLIPDGAAMAAATFRPVTGTPGLQAADLVANYFYGYAKKWIDDSGHEPDPHLWSLLRSGPHVIDGFMGETEIIDMASKMRANNPWLCD